MTRAGVWEYTLIREESHLDEELHHANDNSDRETEP
jgi:hypothetical protein